MCCFSRRVDSVSHTNIFARSAGESRQYVVYEMRLRAKENLAMILPIPVAERAKPDAVRFINLKEYRTFFSDLHGGFPPLPTSGIGRGAAGGVKKLDVVEVGDFEASFVPTVGDFSRLDERFRLPTDTWNHLPAYKEFGFAVFKLKPGGSDHPMAFEFPRATPESLFFPTVHIHDGEVHPTAMFDHRLYCQCDEKAFPDIVHWQESTKPAGSFMDLKKAQGLIDPDSHCYLRTILGKQKNEDVVLA